MLLSVEVTMVVLATFIVEPNNAATVLALECSGLGSIVLPGTGSGTCQTTTSTIAPSGKTVLNRWRKIAAILLSFMPSSKPVIKHANGPML
jgi:hypothetical protein